MATSIAFRARAPVAVLGALLVVTAPAGAEGQASGSEGQTSGPAGQASGPARIAASFAQLQANDELKQDDTIWITLGVGGGVLGLLAATSGCGGYDPESCAIAVGIGVTAVGIGALTGLIIDGAINRKDVAYRGRPWPAWSRENPTGVGHRWYTPVRTARCSP